MSCVRYPKLISLAALLLCCVSCFGQALLADDSAATTLPVPATPVTRIHDLSLAIEAHARLSELPEALAKVEALTQLFLPLEGEEFVKQRVGPGRFEVVASPAFHDHLASIAKWMEEGEKQVVIESRIFRLPEDALRKLHSQFSARWEMENDKDWLKSLEPGEVNPPGVRLSYGSFSQNGAPTHQLATSTASLVTNLPCRTANIPNEQIEALLDRAQADTRTNLIQAPKVTVFPGQEAVIKDTTQHPFVTSVRPVNRESGTALQPIITVLEDGLTLQLRPSLLDGNVHIDGEITLSTVGDVAKFTFGEADPHRGTTVQIPEFRQQRVHLSKTVQAGQSLLVDPHFARKTVVKRRFRGDLTTREFTVMVLTATVIKPKDVQSSADVAKL